MGTSEQGTPNVQRPSASCLDRRRAGILLHPTSLPGGDLGPDAYRFVEFLHAAGLTVWQTLPLGPHPSESSPYHCVSVHAGNPALISLEALVEQGWLARHAPQGADGECAAQYRETRLAAAYQGFLQRASTAEREAFDAFTTAHRDWLEDYALYQALKHERGGASWWEWPAAQRDRRPEALRQARRRLADTVALRRFEQFVFSRQWDSLKRYAHTHGIRLFGDMPIFVAHDSAEVWAQRDYFALDTRGQPETIAGVPPDYFSATGQRWGNPHYRWEKMQADGFQWWRQRLRTQLDLFDLVRIDHFRGFEAYWEIPAHAPTALQGRWVQAPGDALFQALRRESDPLPLVAEDLGIITPEVDALRQRHGLPGMKILQFAFDGSPDNPYLPHNHVENCVVYTGTHDNDTTLGWFESLPPAVRSAVLDYLGEPGVPMPWALVRSAFASVARLAMVPMQDLLGLGSAARMNAPGTTQGNWRWRFSWDQVPWDLAARLRHLVRLYGRTV